MLMMVHSCSRDASKSAVVSAVFQFSRHFLAGYRSCDQNFRRCNVSGLTSSIWDRLGRALGTNIPQKIPCTGDETTFINADDRERAIYVSIRRKFWSQTSDNMDRWKSRGRKRHRRERQKKEDQRRERVRRKNMQVREKVEQSRLTVFFQCFVSVDGPKVGLLKRRVRSHVGRWEMNKCTPFWREARLKVKMLKTAHAHSTPCSDHFWKFRCWKRCTAFWRETLLEVKVLKAPQVRSHLAGWEMKNCTRFWREAHAEVKMYKTCQLRSISRSWDVEKVHTVVARSTFRS